MWNQNMYKALINRIVTNGTFNGTTVKTREQLYKIMANALYVSVDTVKGWTRPNSSGPKDQEMVNKLEEFLGIKKGTLTKQEEEIIVEEQINITDANKTAIFTAYSLIKAFLCDEKAWEGDDGYFAMVRQVQKQRVLIPDVMYTKIMGFVEERVSPMIYDRVNYFGEDAKNGKVFVSEDGRMASDDEKALFGAVMNYYVNVMAIEDDLDDFMMREIHPYLV